MPAGKTYKFQQGSNSMGSQQLLRSQITALQHFFPITYPQKMYRNCFDKTLLASCSGHVSGSSLSCIPADINRRLKMAGCDNSATKLLLSSCLWLAKLAQRKQHDHSLLTCSQNLFDVPRLYAVLLDWQHMCVSHLLRRDKLLSTHIRSIA